MLKFARFFTKKALFVFKKSLLAHNLYHRLRKWKYLEENSQFCWLFGAFFGDIGLFGAESLLFLEFGRLRRSIGEGQCHFLELSCLHYLKFRFVVLVFNFRKAKLLDLFGRS